MRTNAIFMLFPRRKTKPCAIYVNKKKSPEPAEIFLFAGDSAKGISLDKNRKKQYFQA